MNVLEEYPKIIARLEKEGGEATEEEFDIVIRYVMLMRLSQL
jgi:hypothetical protein